MKPFNPNDYHPTPKQEQFLTSKAQFVCYGGARGGGKSWAIDYKSCNLASAFPGIKVLLIRKRQTDVLDNHLEPLKQMVGSSAEWSETYKTFKWHNGSIIRFGYCDRPEDLEHLQGQEYQVIFIEEATQFTYDEFTMLLAICRGGKKSWPRRIYLTCNPGGVGHAWVKRLFIDRQYTKFENPDDYEFIPAFVQDNPYVGSKYIHMLELQQGSVKDAWLYGKWDTVSGQFFNEWKRSVHVINPMPIPANSRRYFVMDYGLDMLAGYWIAVDVNGTAYVYREIYQGKDLEGSEGLIVSEAANAILSLEEANENIYARYAPPDLWSKSSSTGKSQAEEFAQNGLLLIKSDNSRIDGWMALREWLKVYKDPKTGKETSNLKIFSTCQNLIRVLPLLQYDTKKPNDAAKVPHELTHAPDALRYWAIMRPFGATIEEPKKHFAFEDMQKEYEARMNPLKDIGGVVTKDYLVGGDEFV